MQISKKQEASGRARAISETEDAEGKGIGTGGKSGRYISSPLIQRVERWNDRTQSESGEKVGG